MEITDEPALWNVAPKFTNLRQFLEQSKEAAPVDEDQRIGLVRAEMLALLKSKTPVTKIHVAATMLHPLFQMKNTTKVTSKRLLNKATKWIEEELVEVSYNNSYPYL